MSTLIVDAILYLLLLIGIGFGGIGIIGLLLFPDCRSRMFTGVRATLIACGVIVLAGIIYGLFNFFTRGGTQYSDFTIHTIIFLAVIFALNITAARMITKRSIKTVVELTSVCNIPDEKTGEQ